MASRTMKKKGGGKVQMYNAQGSKEAHEAEDEKEDFKKGGKAKHELKSGGKAEGKEAKHRGDKKPRAFKRASGGRTPFSSGHEMTEPKGVNSGHQSQRP